MGVSDLQSSTLPESKKARLFDDRFNLCALPVTVPVIEIFLKE